MKTVGWNNPVDDADQWDGFNEPGIAHFAGSPIRYLAREANQNSFDEAVDGLTVRVVMRHLSVETASIPNVDELRETIERCKAAASKESPKAEQFFTSAAEELAKKKISVLEISDFHTHGMRGPSENGTPFYAFMKAKGQSRKESATATGSFGIGKFAPYAVSKLRTVFVSTVFQDGDGKYHQLTQGKSILMSHDDGSKKRRQGFGFWGIQERCQPIAGISPDIPAWILRSDDEAKLAESKGTKLTILAFDSVPGWQENLAASVAENFFGAINAGKLEVDVDSRHILNKDTITDFFEKKDIRTAIEKQKNEPDQFDNCSNYLVALQDSPEVIIEESEMQHLGLCQLRILLDEALPKKVCVLRNGMFISDSLAGLKSFSDFKEFVAVVECKTKKGLELLRAMEPPRHDDFEPELLLTRDEQKKGAKALKDLAAWVREMLKRHAKNPVSEVTALDELKEYFADDSGEGAGKGTEEIDPYGEIIIRAKPLKLKAESLRPKDEESDDGTGGDGGEGGGGAGGAGGGDGLGGTGTGEGGTGSGEGGNTSKPSVAINNVRAVIADSKNRRVSFTPSTNGQIALGVMEAGADTDYAIAIATSDKGVVKDGKVVVDVKANSRLTLEICLDEEFTGALKVMAHEI